MPASTAQKLKIREAYTLLTIDAPADFASRIDGLAPSVKMSANAKHFDQVHWFVKDKAGMERVLPKVLPLVKGDVVCWIYYPKGSSKLQTDLTRDKGWEELLKADMQWLSLISFDDTWSAFGMREKTEAVRNKDAAPAARPILDYADPVAKTVKLPEDLASAFKNHPQEKAAFEKLAYSHKKEYVEWIVMAKREETRKARIEGTIEKLGKGMKNPSAK